ncbi:Abi family protein [Acinetobacter baumannii]
MPMLSTEISDVINLISIERLNAYKTTFNTQNDHELVGVYLWNINLSSLFFRLSTMVEVSLRNSINNSLHTSLGNTWWQNSKLHYLSYSSSSTHVIPDNVKQLRQCFVTARKSAIREKKERYGISGYIPTHSEIISATSFNTWELILDKEFVGNTLIWPSNLGKTFKGSWPNNSSSQLLQELRDDLKNIRLFRNRLAHNEAIWKAHGVNNEQDAIGYLLKKLKTFHKVISLISPEKIKFIEVSGVIKDISNLLSSESIVYHKKNPKKVLNIKSLSEMKFAAKTAYKTKNPVHITYGNKQFKILIN